MLANSWKKICLIILIIACLWNIISKFLYKVSFEKAVDEFQMRSAAKQTVTNTTK